MPGSEAQMLGQGGEQRSLGLASPLAGGGERSLMFSHMRGQQPRGPLPFSACSSLWQCLGAPQVQADGEQRMRVTGSVSSHLPDPLWMV